MGLGVRGRGRGRGRVRVRVRVRWYLRGEFLQCLALGVRAVLGRRHGRCLGLGLGLGLVDSGWG